MNATGLLNTASNATIRIADEYAALRINSRIHEVEQVSIVWIVAIAAGSSEIANRATLHRIIRRGVSRGPGRTAIKGRGDVKMPRRALIVGRLIRVVPDFSRAEEGVRRAVVIPGDHLGEG